MHPNAKKPPLRHLLGQSRCRRGGSAWLHVRVWCGSVASMRTRAPQATSSDTRQGSTVARADRSSGEGGSGGEGSSWRKGGGEARGGQRRRCLRRRRQWRAAARRAAAHTHTDFTHTHARTHTNTQERTRSHTNAHVCTRACTQRTHRPPCGCLQRSRLRAENRNERRAWAGRSTNRSWRVK